MRRAFAFGFAACCMAAACGVRLDGNQPTGPDGSQPTPDAPAGDDAMADGPPALGPWGTPTLVPGASTTAIEDDGSLSSTTLEMVFAVVDPAQNNTKDLYYMSRASATAAWSAPQKLGFNTTSSEETPRFSADDLTLYFASNRAGGPGLLDIYKVTRSAVGAAWGAAQLVSGVSTTAGEKWYMPCAADNTYLVILDTNIGQGTVGSAPMVCAELSSAQTETGTFLSRDCKTVYFASNRSGTNKLYMATRASTTATWGTPTEVVDFAGLGGAQEDPWLAPDLRTFVFVSNVSGTKDVYISTR